MKDGCKPVQNEREMDVAPVIKTGAPICPPGMSWNISNTLLFGTIQLKS